MQHTFVIRVESLKSWSEALSRSKHEKG